MAWKMFAIICTFALVLEYVAAEIPSFIQICGRKNPDLDKCIMNSIDNLKSRICKGISELQSPPLEPFFINKIDISNIENSKLQLKDLQIMGFCDFNINSVHIDLDKLHFDASISLKKIRLNGTYDFDIRVLVSFAHKGPVFLITDNVIANIGVDMKMINKDSKKYIYISKINLKLDIKTLESKFDTNEEESSQLNEILSTFVGSNKEEMINRIKPSIEKEITEQLLKIGNNIVKHFTYDELFPDQA